MLVLGSPSRLLLWYLRRWSPWHVKFATTPHQLLPQRQTAWKESHTQRKAWSQAGSVLDQRSRRMGSACCQGRGRLFRPPSQRAPTSTSQLLALLPISEIRSAVTSFKVVTSVPNWLRPRHFRLLSDDALGRYMQVALRSGGGHAQQAHRKREREGRVQAHGAVPRPLSCLGPVAT